MTIAVGENYKIGADKLNIILYCKDTVDLARSERMKSLWKSGKFGEMPEKISDDKEDKAEKGWKVEGYYSSIENCYNALLRMEINKTELKDLKTVLDSIKEVEQSIKISLSGISKCSVEQSLGRGQSSSATQE